MTAWIANNLAKVLVPLLIVLLLAGALTARSCSRAHSAKVGEAVATSQAAAATASGRDAVAVTGARAQADTAVDAQTRTNDAEIRHAQGADAAVAAPVRDAGLRSLCARAAYRSDPKCLQYARSRDMGGPGARRAAS